MSIKKILNDSLIEEYLSFIPDIKPNLFQGCIGTDEYYQSVHYAPPSQKLSSTNNVQTSLEARLERLGMLPQWPLDPDEVLFFRLLVPELHNKTIEALKRMFSSFFLSTVDSNPSLAAPIPTKEFLNKLRPTPCSLRSKIKTIPGVHTTLLTSRDGKHVFHQSLPSGKPLSKSDLIAENSYTLARNVQDLLSKINRTNYLQEAVYDFNPDEFDATGSTSSIWVDRLDRVYACGTTVLIPSKTCPRTHQIRIEANDRVLDELIELAS